MKRRSYLSAVFAFYEIQCVKTKYLGHILLEQVEYGKIRLTWAFGDEKMSEKESNKFADRIKDCWYKASIFMHLNIKFILFNLILTAILVISICGSGTIDTDFIVNNQQFDKLGILCQIITAVVCCITSLVGISFSLQNDQFFGIATKDMYKLRADIHYSYVLIITIPVLLVVANLCAYLSGNTVFSFGISIASVLFCLYVIAEEVPIMTKSDKAGIKILKKRFLHGATADDYNIKNYNATLKYLILKFNLKTTYEQLKYDSKLYKEKNESLLCKLLSVQTDIAFHVANIENQAEKIEVINCLESNIRDIISNSFDIKKILSGKLSSYGYLITRVLFGISQDDEGKRVAANICDSAVSRLNNDLLPTENKQLISSVILVMISKSVPYGELVYINAVRRYFSGFHYSLEKKYTTTTLFAVISMYIYYLCRIESSMQEKNIEKIEEFIDKTCVENNEYLLSWKRLFNENLSENFNVDLNEYMDMFRKNETSMEYYVYGGEASIVELTEQYAIDWYMSNYLNSYSAMKIDYEMFDNFVKRFGHYDLCSFADKCFDDNKKFKEYELMQNVYEFFGVSNAWSSIFIKNEEQTHSFFDYVNKKKYNKEKANADTAAEISNKELEYDIGRRIKNAVVSEWMFNGEIEIEDHPIYLNMLITKENNLPNYYEEIAQAFVRGIFKEIRKITKKSKNIIRVLRQDDFDIKIKEAIDDKFEYATRGAKYTTIHYIKDKDTAESYNEIVSKTEEIESGIFTGNTLFMKDGFMFNVDINSFKVSELEGEGLAAQVEQYKRPDGQYVYRGIFISRDDLAEIIKKEVVFLTLEMNYAVRIAPSSIVDIVHYPALYTEDEEIYV